MICRLFGFAARRNKYAKRELVTCTVIKTEQQESYLSAEAALGDESRNVPVFTDYYERLRNLDPNLGGDLMPINQAIRRALDVVAQYMDYASGDTI